MKKTIGLIIFITMVSLSGCTKDADEVTNDNLAQNSVKDWFNTTFKNSKEWQQNDDSPNKAPDWDKGTYLKKDSLEVFEFPLKEDYAKIIIPKDKSLTNKEVTKILDATLTRLVIIKADTNTMVVRKLYYVPDYNYLLLKGNDLNKVVFGNDGSDFTGLLITKSWNDEVLSCLNVKDGKIEGMLVKKDANSNLTARTANQLDEVMIWNSYHKPIDYGNSYSSQPYVYSPVYPNNPYGMGSSGGSGGGGSNQNSNVTITLIGPRNAITSIKEYLKCFNVYRSATLTIYVDQPIPNSSDAYTMSGDVGHTFIALQQDDTRRVLGYWPATSVNPVTSTTDKKAFGNDENHFFDVSISTPLSPTQLRNIIEYCNNVPSTYDLNNYNCTDFGIEVGNLAGLKLPDSYGSWPNGGGSNPGQLGQYIRNMQLPANTIRQTTGANSASNKGVCN